MDDIIDDRRFATDWADGHLDKDAIAEKSKGAEWRRLYE